ncbi:MAG: peptidoglycan binding protein CsiV [Natronospirillum sp.]|uniref:CsiV family protein n=1 Tax=Natronospirillum sp. TaxID=2812955 RepID=UPI0025D0BD97|nr:CsiV family protein [Natronospirillum sp.]MCH8552889.1 peptidoglycan binding protein CsiV [Natronospirillum sp.]
MNRLINPGNTLVLTLLLALVVSPAVAQDTNPNVGRWYQVELILFEQRQEPEYNEIWPTFPNLTGTQDAMQLRKAPDSSSSVIAPLPALDLTPPPELPPRWPLIDFVDGIEESLIILPRPLLQFTDEARRVNESRGRRVLLHTGWNMPVSAEANRDIIRLHAGRRFDEHYELDGTIAIHVGRFLHVETDLYQTQYELNQEPLPLISRDGLPTSLMADGEFSPPMRSGGSTFRTGPRFVPVEAAHFAEQRRMRSNELHYIDHPRLGMLIQFTPYTPAEVTTGGELIESDIDPDAEDDLEGADEEEL